MGARAWCRLTDRICRPVNALRSSTSLGFHVAASPIGVGKFVAAPRTIDASLGDCRNSSGLLNQEPLDRVRHLREFSGGPPNIPGAEIAEHLPSAVPPRRSSPPAPIRLRCITRPAETSFLAGHLLQKVCGAVWLDVSDISEPIMSLKVLE
jgi:hypothetical protein